MVSRHVLCRAGNVGDDDTCPQMLSTTAESVPGRSSHFVHMEYRYCIANKAAKHTARRWTGIRRQHTCTVLHMPVYLIRKNTSKGTLVHGSLTRQEMPDLSLQLITRTFCTYWYDNSPQGAIVVV